MKPLNLSLLILSVSLFTVGATAQEQQKPSSGGQLEGAAADQAQPRLERAKQRRDQAQQRRGRGKPDPSRMAARMMRQFDQDGDQKLNSAELTKMLAAMQQRGRGRMRQGGRPGRPGENMKRRRREGDNPATPGGDRPKRPPADEV